MTTQINCADGTISVDYAEGEVLLECACPGGPPFAYWLSTDQALELASAIVGAVLNANRSARENREPRKCGWCGETSCLRGDVCSGDE